MNLKEPTKRVYELTISGHLNVPALSFALKNATLADYFSKRNAIATVVFNSK